MHLLITCSSDDTVPFNSFPVAAIIALNIKKESKAYCMWNVDICTVQVYSTVYVVIAFKLKQAYLIFIQD